jgi:4-hydroxy-4-methyl-2-oxoglutarate aldolase
LILYISIKEKVMYQIIDDFERPDSDLVKEFSKIATSTLSDAMGRYGAATHEIKPIDPSFHMVGPAYTIRCYVKDNLMLHYGLMHANPGDILVVEAGGYSEGAFWGELMSIMAKRKQLGGIVLDTGARDRCKIREIGFPVFSRSVLPMGTLKDSPGSINIPVQCGGVVVNSGDIVVGDDDGVVVIPKEDAKTVLKNAITILKKEEDIRERMASGEVLFDILGLDKIFSKMQFAKKNERTK